jgi:outer membrane protein TolC
MISRDYSSRFSNRCLGTALCAALLLGSTALAQSSTSGPVKLVWFLQPKAADEQPKQVPGKDMNPPPGEKIQMPEKGLGPKEIDPIAQALPAPKLEPGEEGLVISLPAALRLANAEAWDIQIAVQQLRIAAADLQGADVLWLPTLVAGVDYQYHSGPTQAADGTQSNISRDNLYAGGSPQAIFGLTDAIFAPLSARQVVRAQDANIQTARNDTLTDLAQAYFDLLESEADLASIMDVDRRAAELVNKIVKLAPGGLVPDLEIDRTKAFRSNVGQVVETARQRWRVASAEVARIARLKPTVVLQPLEPPHMRVTLVPETMTPDELIPIALSRRPELTFYEAQAAAARERERQEKWRPFLPTLIARGGGTTPPYPMAVGVYSSGIGSNLSNSAQRSDWDLSAVWTLQNLGLGNVALIRTRRAEYELARVREYRFRDVVAKEVTVAWADLRSASRRMALADRELREAEISARQNMIAVSEIRRIAKDGINLQVIRTQEVVQALQALNSAYFNYYGVVAEYNRAQFRMYRALGNPAQMLDGHNGLGGPPLTKDGK